LSYSNDQNIDEKNLQFLGSLSSEWWDPMGPMMPLHKMNPLRISYIRDGLISTGRIKREDKKKPDVFRGIKILEVGCGAGVLSEELAKYRADVTALDPSEELLNVAKDHLKGQSLNVEYICEFLEQHLIDNAGKYDAVVASEVIEHVPDQKALLHEMVQSLKPNGSLFITTPNRTIMSWLLIKIVAEYVLHVIPKGAHVWSHFIKPSEVTEILKEKNCKTVSARSFWFTPIINKFSFVKYTGTQYALHAVKHDSLGTNL
jgi:polyprenyldihydroxybenzoate methyltransferase/3-demethylubiquinol 3-O-methyltransferase